MVVSDLEFKTQTVLINSIMTRLDNIYFRLAKIEEMLSIKKERPFDARERDL